MLFRLFKAPRRNTQRELLVYTVEYLDGDREPTVQGEAVYMKEILQKPDGEEVSVTEREISR
jgi:hypothetical protein